MVPNVFNHNPFKEKLRYQSKLHKKISSIIASVSKIGYSLSWWFQISSIITHIKKKRTINQSSIQKISSIIIFIPKTHYSPSWWFQISSIITHINKKCAINQRIIVKIVSIIISKSKMCFVTNCSTPNVLIAIAHTEIIFNQKFKYFQKHQS